MMPFGGIKAPDYGRFDGCAVVAELTELRWITIQDGDPRSGAASGSRIPD